MSYGRRRYPPERRGGWVAPVLALLAVGLVIGAYFLGRGAGGGTRTVRTPAATASSDTIQGAVLAAANVYSRDLKDQWSTSLGYRVVSFTPQQATVQTMERVRLRSKGHHVVWIASNILVAYRQGGWVKIALHAPLDTPPVWTSPPTALIGRFKPWPAA